MTTATIHAPANTNISRWLMIATYAIGGLGLAFSFSALGADDAVAAGAWAAVVAVGGSGVLSFFRHSVFHRSDAARMGWDYGRRNDFQIEVGLANLSWGLAGIAAWAFGWGTAAEGAITVVFGLYLLSAAVLHAVDLVQSRAQGGGRVAPVLATGAFSAGLLYAGISIIHAA